MTLAITITLDADRTRYTVSDGSGLHPDAVFADWHDAETEAHGRLADLKEAGRAARVAWEWDVGGAGR